MLRSRLCTQEQFDCPYYRRWCARLGEPPRLHRKQWEFCFIAQALFERGMLAPAKKGLGFGVGREPLPSLFASFGCQIIATDSDPGSAEQGGWSETGQYAGQVSVLNERGLCDSIEFEKLVSLKTADMNEIPRDLHGFDFIWSSCAFEHLGSLERGLQFVLDGMWRLNPNGVAVHTTEFNLSSDTETLAEGGTVLYRRRDIQRLVEELTREGHQIEVDFEPGGAPADQHVDMPPYKLEPHLKLQIEGFVCTSIGLIIGKG